MAVEYLKKYGPLALGNGYSVIPIRPGEKRPFGKDWESVEYTQVRIEKL